MLSVVIYRIWRVCKLIDVFVVKKLASISNASTTHPESPDAWSCGQDGENVQNNDYREESDDDDDCNDPIWKDTGFFECMLQLVDDVVGHVFFKI